MDEFQNEILIHLNIQSSSWNYAVENLSIRSKNAAGITSLGQNSVILGGKKTNGEILATHTIHSNLF
jgi:hypothetical protein